MQPLPSPQPPSLLADAASFFRHPSPAPSPPATPATKAARTVRAWSLAFLAAIPLGCLVALFAAAFGRGLSQHALFELVRSGSPLATFALAAVVAPVMEESAFRLGLRPSRLTISVGGAMFVYFCLRFALGALPDSVGLSDALKPSTPAGLVAGLITVVALACVAWLGASAIGMARLNAAYERRYGWIFFGSAIAFALMHASNFEGMGWLVLAAPILTLPQLVLGLMLAYVRLRFGFIWAILAHGLHNAIALTPTLLIAGIAPDALQSMLSGDQAAIGALTAGQTALISAVSLGFIALMVAMYTSLGWSLLEWARARRGKQRALMATVLSVLVPGFGQLYNGQPGKGAAMFVAWLVAVLFAVLALVAPSAGARALVAVALFGCAGGGYALVLAISVIDALAIGARHDQAEAAAEARASIAT